MTAKLIAKNCPIGIKNLRQKSVQHAVAWRQHAIILPPLFPMPCLVCLAWLRSLLPGWQLSKCETDQSKLCATPPWLLSDREREGERGVEREVEIEVQLAARLAQWIFICSKSRQIFHKSTNGGSNRGASGSWSRRRRSRSRRRTWRHAAVWWLD